MASGSEKGWSVTGNGRSPALLVELRQRSYVLPWSLFLFAEGNDASVRAVFHSHLLEMEGCGLTALLSDFAQHTVARISEPDRTAKFSSSAGPAITALTLRENRS
jgi:hypothetical protein